MIDWAHYFISSILPPKPHKKDVESIFLKAQTHEDKEELMIINFFLGWKTEVQW